MKCEVCKIEVPREKNSVVCSEKCQSVRLKAFEITDKYFPTNGCDNCLGDLNRGCSEKCQQEFRDVVKFGRDIWSIIHLIYPAPEEKQND